MNFLVVDDHPLVREALASLLLELRPGRGCSRRRAARRRSRPRAAARRWIWCCWTLRLPDGSGLDLLRRIGAASIGTAVVMLSGDLDRQTVQEALAAGAVGYVPKTEPREIIAGALGLVLAGGVYVPPVALQTAARTFDTRAATPEALGLTGRQLEVLALLMQGKNNKLICRALGLAEPTVKNHVSAILRALGWTAAPRPYWPSRARGGRCLNRAEAAASAPSAGATPKPAFPAWAGRWRRCARACQWRCRPSG